MSRHKEIEAAARKVVDYFYTGVRPQVVMSNLRMALDLLPDPQPTPGLVDAVKAVNADQILEIIQDLRSYTYDWDWKYGKQWDIKTAEIRKQLDNLCTVLAECGKWERVTTQNAVTDESIQVTNPISPVEILQWVDHFWPGAQVWRGTR